MGLCPEILPASKLALQNFLLSIRRGPEQAVQHVAGLLDQPGRMPRLLPSRLQNHPEELEKSGRGEARRGVPEAVHLHPETGCPKEEHVRTQMQTLTRSWANFTSRKEGCEQQEPQSDKGGGLRIQESKFQGTFAA